MEIIYLLIGMLVTVIILAIAFFLMGFIGIYSLINELKQNKNEISVTDRICIAGNNTRKYISHLFLVIYYSY
jgi:hypothetical protein